MPSPRRIPIFDGHNDVLLRLLSARAGRTRSRRSCKGEDKGHLDLPKARKGGFAGGLFAIFVPSPKRKDRAAGETPPQEAGNVTGSVIGSDPAPPAVDVAEAQRVVFAMASLLFRIERESKGRVRVCRTAGDIERCLADDVLAAVLHIEGAEAIDANFELLDVLHAAGLRSLGPVWSRPNAFGHGVPFRCPSSPDTGPGLTDLGKALIGACNRAADSDRSVAPERTRLLGRSRNQQCAAGRHALQRARHQPAFAQSDRPAIGGDRPIRRPRRRQFRDELPASGRPSRQGHARRT